MYFRMKKVLIVLIVAIPVIFWGIWIAVPATSIQTIIEDSVIHPNINLEVKGLKKGLFYTLHIDNVMLKSSHQEMISLDNIYGYINPLSLITLRLNISMDGNIGSGNISGNMNLTKNKMQTSLNFNKANINAIPIFKIIGIQGTGTVSGRIIVENDTGHIEIITKDASFEPAIFSGIKVPLNFFHNVTGSIEIKGNIINIVSVSLEGKDIYARLKGAIKNAVMDLNMEVMPGKSFIENPLFLFELEKHKVSPGYYVIPVKGYLSM